MKIDNINIGQVIKDYPTLCKILEMEPKKNNSKIAQLNELKRFINYHNEGRNFVIDEIYKEPKQKIEKRGGARNTLPFLDELEIIFIDLLIRQKNDRYIKSDSRLLLELSLSNNHYWKYFNNKELLSEIIKMDIGYILDFYDSTNSTFKSAINTIIKRLTNKALITHDKPMIVIKVDTFATIAPQYKTLASDIVDYDYKKNKYILITDHSVTEEYRIATNDELKKILEIEHDVLVNKYGKESKQQLFANGTINRYYHEVSKIVYKTLDIRKHYQANRIIFERENLQKEYKRLLNKNNIDDIKEIMNNKTIERIVNNSQNKKKLSLVSEEDKRSNRDETRLNDNYIDNIKYLGESIIKYDNEIELSKRWDDFKKDNIDKLSEQTIKEIDGNTYVKVDEIIYNIDDE